VSWVDDGPEETGRHWVLEAPGFGTCCVDVVYCCGGEESGCVWRVLDAKVFSGLVFVFGGLVPFTVLVL
jgi:hypothetical protein